MKLVTRLGIPSSSSCQHQGLKPEDRCAVQPSRCPDPKHQDPTGYYHDASVFLAPRGDIPKDKIGTGDDQHQDCTALKQYVATRQDQGLETWSSRSCHCISEDMCHSSNDTARKPNCKAAICKGDCLPGENNLPAVRRVPVIVAPPEYLPLKSDSVVSITFLI